MIKGEPDFLNFLKTPLDMKVEGKYDMPVIKGVILKRPEKLKFVELNEAHNIPKSQRKEYVVEFFLADYLFERVWSRLKPMTEFLKQFKAVLQPDFSQYTDMPRAMQIWNNYRTQFVSQYWQNHGITVIPIARWSDKRSFSYVLDGMPKRSCICISSVGCWHSDAKAENSETNIQVKSNFRHGCELTIKRLEPKQILWYGKVPRWVRELCESKEVQLIECPALYNKRFNKDS